MGEGRRGTPAFVGRGVELGELRAALTRAREGEPTLVRVEAPSGRGKSALLREFTHALEDARVLRAVAEPTEEDVAFGVVEQLLRAGGDRAPIDRAGEPAAVGTRLLEVVAGGMAASGDSGGEVTVVVVDDAQWADPASVAALVFARRRLAADRVLAVVAARPDGATRLARLCTDDDLVVPVAGLDVEDVLALCRDDDGGGLPRERAAELARHTDGNPLHLTELLAEFGAARLAREDRPLPAPEGYAAFVGERLARCPGAVRDLVAAAAVLGERCTLRDAMGVAGADTDATGLDVVDSAVDTGLVEVDDAAGAPALVFPHRLTRAAVRDGLALSRRVEMHALAARTVRDTDAVLGHRVAAALAPDADLATDLTARAERLAGDGELSRAGAHRLSAARLRPDPGARSADLLEAAELLVQGSETDRVQAVSAVQGLESGARRSYVLGQAAFAQGRVRQAEEHLDAAWTDAQDDDLRIRIAQTCCRLSYLQLRTEDSLRWGERARDAGSPPFPAWITSLAFAGRLDDDAATTAGVDGLDAAMAQGARQLWTEQLDAAVRTLADAATGMRRAGRYASSLQATSYLVLATHRLGMWDVAVAHAEEAITFAQDVGAPWTVARLHGCAALPHAARGHRERVREHLAAARSAARTTGLRLDTASTAVAAAYDAWYADEPAAVIELLTPLHDAAPAGRQGPVAEPGVSLWPCLLAEALHQRGEPTRALAVLDRYESRAVELGLWRSASAATRVRGLVEAGAGRPRPAEAALRRAASLVDEQSPEGAMARLGLGGFLRDRGRRDEALPEIAAARATFDRLGSGPLAARCDREVAACGAAPGGPVDRPADRLTPREFAVARLAVRGSSNAAIASELVVSVATVEFHLRNVFAKLGVSSRREIVDHLGEL